MSNKRGLMIVLEGCDRAGKTTQCELLDLYFKSKGLPCELMKFPDRTTTLGKMIDGYLQGTQDLSDQAIHLLFSANRWEKMETIKNKLEQGINLIVDRYAYSGVSFTAAKGLDVSWCKSCDIGLIIPDIVLFLDTNNQLMAQRKDFGSERYEKLDFQLKVREKFFLLKDDSWKVIDASLTIETIHKQLQEHVSLLLACDDLEPIKTSLWKS